MIKKLLLASMTSIFVMNAQALELGAPIKTSITIEKPGSQGMVTEKQDIYLMNIKLTPKQKQLIMSYTPKPEKVSLKTDHSLPSQVQLGMNGVPVLYQGSHGSCVTFANTAAIDAALGQGDYISQLCGLELGNYLAAESYYTSGWNGSYGVWVLDQIFRFGIVNKNTQTEVGCADVKDYPLKDQSAEGNVMSPEEFKAKSEMINNNIYYIQHMNWFDRMSKRYTDTDESEIVLHKVKLALNKGNRVTFGAFLIIGPYCSAGACAKFHKNFDTWALTKELETPPYETGGHEMVITGYDDNASAIDTSGHQHKGLLTLRNSWSSQAGDEGNYYMTYDYFKKFANEVQEIAVIKED